MPPGTAPRSIGRSSAADNSPPDNPRPAWIATVRTLLEAGASAEEITLSPDDPKPPSPEVAVLLRRHGVASEPGSPG